MRELLAAAALALLGCQSPAAPAAEPVAEPVATPVATPVVTLSFKTPVPTAADVTSSPSPSTVALARHVCVYTAGGAMPDPSCTPGVWNPAVTKDTIDQTICVPHWTDTIRPPSAYTTMLKRRQLLEYGLPIDLGAYEEDHWFPLVGGGHPTDPRNLFPMPIALARQKDVKERLLSNNICGRRQTLEEEHRLWEAGWQTYH